MLSVVTGTLALLVLGSLVRADNSQLNVLYYDDIYNKDVFDYLITNGVTNSTYSQAVVATDTTNDVPQYTPWMNIYILNSVALSNYAFEVTASSLNNTIGTVGVPIGHFGMATFGDYFHVQLMFNCNLDGRFVTEFSVINVGDNSVTKFYVGKQCGVTHPRKGLLVGVDNYLAIQDGVSTTPFLYSNVFTDKHLSSPPEDSNDIFAVYLGDSSPSSTPQPFSVSEVVFDMDIMNVTVTYVGAKPPLAVKGVPNEDGTPSAGMSGFQVVYTCYSGPLMMVESVVSVSLSVPGFDGVNMSWIKQCGGALDIDLFNISIILMVVMVVLCGCSGFSWFLKRAMREERDGDDSGGGNEGRYILADSSGSAVPTVYSAGGVGGGGGGGGSASRATSGVGGRRDMEEGSAREEGQPAVPVPAFGAGGRRLSSYGASEEDSWRVNEPGGHELQLLPSGNRSTDMHL